MTTTTAATTTYFAPRRLGHVNLWVGDIATSEKFYGDVCGLTVEFTEPDLVASFMGTGHTPHDLGMIQKTNGIDRYGRNGLLQLPGSVGHDAGLNHLAWELENEAQLIAAYKHLKDAGIATDMTVDHQVAHSVYMFDPDMNYNEFYCDTVKDWRTILHGPMDLISGHWDPLTADGFTEGRYETDPVLRSHPTAPLRPHRISHAVLETDNMAAMLAFYTSVAGLTVVADDGDAVYLAASHGDYPYNLVLLKSAAKAYHHAAFELPDAESLDSAKAALAEQGVALEAEVDLPWKRSLFLRDPDGLASEWFVKLPAVRDLTARGDVPLALAA
jgi:catechol 2,3-dioxygenase